MEASMEEKKLSYLEFESSMARMERLNTKVFILCIILTIALIGSNMAWLIYESRFEDVVVTQEAQADGESDINLQNVSGDYYGSESKANSKNP